MVFQNTFHMYTDIESKAGRAKSVVSWSMFDNQQKTKTRSEKTIRLLSTASGMLAREGTSYLIGNLTPLSLPCWRGHM